ncbi:DUF4836 family protein [Dysgonomonas sp. 216]|uniref:DUF4836 family protein n=1 Tax=Dysgonomonas sp. 216 TaxID=2302934 RepID=UPI0013D093B3|nr:DUF4836 family protein [Dysgonomonas sp. 216]NDW19153.1 DUF4836 family protein [Dysgonomonas sp. 216]
MRISKLFLVLATAVFAFSSCKKTTQDLADAIPADMGYVVHINTQSMIEKSNYDIFKNVTVQRGINMAKAMIGSEQSVVDMIDAFTKDVNSLGLNLKNEAYFYTDYKTFGVILGVNNADKLKQSLLNIPNMKESEMLKEEDGIHYISMGNNGVFAWNKEKFLIIASMNMYNYRNSNNESVDMLAMAKKQLTQGKDQSIRSKEAFAKFEGNKKDISVFYAYSPDMFKSMFAMSGITLPEGASAELDKLDGVSQGMYISFEKGEIAASNDMFYNSAEIEAKYKELGASICGELKGEQLKYIAENPIFVMSANLKGAGIYDFLKRIGVIEKIEDEVNDEENGINVQSIVSNIEGDITLGLTNILSIKKERSWGEYDSTFPEFSLMMDMKDGKSLFDLLKMAIGKAESEDLKQIDENTYSGDIEGTTAYVGLTNNMLYFTNSEATYNAIKSSSTISKGYDALAKGKAVMFAGNIKSLKAPVLKEVSDKEANTLLGEFIDLFDKYEYAGSNEDANGKLAVTDSSKNSLAVIFQYVDKLLTAMNDKMR